MAYLDFTGATQAKSALLDKIKVMFQELYTDYVAEIETARDGESTLGDKIDAIDDSIAAIAAGSGVTVSANDTTVGTLSTKLTSTDGTITFAETNDGGAETLDLSYGGKGVDTTSSAADVTLTSTSNQVQEIAMTAAGKSVTLPDPSTLPDAGADVFVFYNAGTFTFGVYNNTGELVCSVAPYKVARVSLVDVTNDDWVVSDDAGLFMRHTKTTANTQAVHELSVCKMTDTTVFAAYQGADSDGFCIMLEVDGNDITVLSNELEFDTTDASKICCCRITDTVAAISYEGPADDGYICAVTFNGTDTLALTDTHEFKDATTITSTTCFAITSSLVFVGYNGYGQVLNWTGTEFTSNTADTVLNAKSIVSYALVSGSASAATIIMVGDTTHQEFNVVSWDGTTLSAGATFTSNYLIEHPSLVVIDNTYFVAVGRDGGTNDVGSIAVLFAIGGTTISFVKEEIISRGFYLAWPRNSGVCLLGTDTVIGVATHSTPGYDSEIFKLRVVGAATAEDAVLSLEGSLFMVDSGDAVVTSVDSTGVISAYLNSADSNYLSAEKIEVG